MTQNKIFISHSSKDKAYVKSFVENILQLGLDIPAERIFCSSIEGQGVKSGEYIPDRLREELNISSLALLFISTNYKSSEICLNELGAAWVKLPKDKVIPILLPNISFNELGFLDFNRLSIKAIEKEGILKIIQDCKIELNPNFNLQKLDKKIENYLTDINNYSEAEKLNEIIEAEEVTKWKDCFANNLYPFNEIIRKAIPAYNDGIYKISDIKIQNQILLDLSIAKFLEYFWYRHADGDYYVKELRKLSSGNWLICGSNWEVKISEMWVCKDIECQYDFILIRSDNMEPYQINSDIGGSDYGVGVLNNGIIISSNEYNNGYAIINGETIDIDKLGAERRYRDHKSHWVFLVTGYHKLGYNAYKTMDFCKKLDNGEIDVNEANIYKFLRSLRNHPIVTLNS